ncbi:MAG: carotenoid biosynthesis protein [Crocinitomicaceae bacterium]|nr:carotenoid biosynthesis protein [Crocinitomicaceae bacterium]
MSAILVLIAEKEQRKSIQIFAFIFVTGFLIELIGVQTALLFGEYTYEPSMGPLLFGTPFIIGATWYAVVAGAASVAGLFRLNIFLKSALAGMLAVIMDLFIEQVAIKYELWRWTDSQPPIYNYICWFVFGSMFAFLYIKNTKNLNKTALSLFWIWLLFFTVLTLF